MIKSVSVLMIALFFFSFAVGGFAYPQARNSQTSTQSQVQAESVRLNATIADLYKQGKYDEALPLANRVLEIERGLGPERPQVAGALGNLAELYFAKKKGAAAEDLFQQAAAIYEKNQINSLPVSEVLERLAQLSFLKRKYDNAIRFFERSLAIREQSYGAESAPVAETIHELANVYQVDRQYQKSEPLYLRSIMIKERLLGKIHPDTVQAMKNYACLRLRLEKTRLAKEEIESDLTGAERERNSVIQRAYCWLHGFKEDCDQESYNPSLKFSTLLNGKAIRLERPSYPQVARSMNISGTVSLAVLIDEEGNVIKVRPVCGAHPIFRDAAVEAARASKFTPTRLNDRAVQVPGIIHYRFSPR